MSLFVEDLHVSEAPALLDPGVATFTDPAGHSWEVAQGLDNQDA